MLSIDDLNALCAEIAEETMEDNISALVDAIEEEELDNMMLALGPRAYGPDPGADDSGGLFYWDLK
jgi:hypothetical protein